MDFFLTFMQISTFWTFGAYSHNSGRTKLRVSQGAIEHDNSKISNNVTKSKPPKKPKKAVGDFLIILDQLDLWNSEQKIVLERSARYLISNLKISFDGNHVALGRLTNNRGQLELKFNFSTHFDYLRAIWHVRFENIDYVQNDTDPENFDLDQSLVQPITEKGIFSNEFGSRPSSRKVVIFLTNRPRKNLRNFTSAFDQARKSDFRLLIAAKRHFITENKNIEQKKNREVLHGYSNYRRNWDEFSHKFDLVDKILNEIRKLNVKVVSIL